VLVGWDFAIIVDGGVGSVVARDVGGDEWWIDLWLWIGMDKLAGLN
jgi:hypothetical protein